MAFAIIPTLIYLHSVVCHLDQQKATDAQDPPERAHIPYTFPDI